MFLAMNINESNIAPFPTVEIPEALFDNEDLFQLDTYTAGQPRIFEQGGFYGQSGHHFLHEDHHHQHHHSRTFDQVIEPPALDLESNSSVSSISFMSSTPTTMSPSPLDNFHIGQHHPPAPPSDISDISSTASASPIAKHHTKVPPKPKFSPEDDSLLIELKEKKKLTWRQIAEHFDGRTAGALQVRYCTKLKSRRNEWSEEDETALKRAIQEYELERWAIISDKLKGKYSASACRDKFKLMKRI